MLNFETLSIPKLENAGKHDNKKLSNLHFQEFLINNFESMKKSIVENTQNISLKTIDTENTEYNLQKYVDRNIRVDTKRGKGFTLTNRVLPQKLQ